MTKLNYSFLKQMAVLSRLHDKLEDKKFIYKYLKKEHFYDNTTIFDLALLTIHGNKEAKKQLEKLYKMI